ncbi:MAG: beta strand repeat-containing protein, partial [Promethearchaeota archaeon]
MRLKYHNYFIKGFLLLLLCVTFSSVSAIRPDNTIHPLYNYFAFGKDGVIKNGLHNQSFVSEEGMKIHEVISDQDAYKFRFIFQTSKNPFDVLSLRVKALFNRNMSGFIRWGGLHNVTISVFPFELVTIEGRNNSVQVINGRDLYRGANIQFNFNTTAFEGVKYFELAFSSWNGSESLRGFQFEQINFHKVPNNYIPETILFLVGSISLISLVMLSPRKFGLLLTILIAIALLIVPLVMIFRAQNFLKAIPQTEEGVERFTFFGRVYERRDLGNGLFSLQMVKDLSTAFELQASSGTGAQVVYPLLETDGENTTEETEMQIERGESDSFKIETEEPTSISNNPSSFYQFQPHFGILPVDIDVSNISITDSDSNVVHAKRTYYSFEVIVSDGDGYGDLDFVQLNFTVNSFEYSVGYDNGTDTFIEINDDGANHITLDTGGGSSTSRNGNYLTVTFSIQTDWDFPNENNVALTAWANDTSSNTDETISTATYDFNHDIEVASFSVNDNNINPDHASNLEFTGDVNYVGTIIDVPDVEIDVVTIFRNDTPLDVNVAIANDTDDVINIFVDSETIMGNYTYYPYVELAGDGSDLNGSATTTQEVHVDCVKITNIVASNFEYDDGSRYWDNDNSSQDEITITITAVWNYTGNPYQGEVNIGYSGNENYYGASSGLVRDIEDDPASGTSITRDGITVGSAVVGTGNDYGTQVYLASGLTFPNVGWDNATPTLSDAMSAYGESGDTDEVYGDDSINTFYFSNSFDSAATVTFTAIGTDSGSGVRGIDFGSFGADNPVEDTSAPYQGQYTLNTDDNSGSITVTIYDNVGNSASDTITCTEDASSPSISITGESESSQYLYSGYGTGIQGVYGSGMGSTQTYTISGTASDVGSDLLSITDDISFGDNPGNTGTVTNWQFAYQIDAADNGDVTVTYTATDNVGNTNTASYTFYEDNTAPTLSDAMSAYGESGDTDEVYGVEGSNTFYFSNSFDSAATITFTATGTDTGPANIRGIDFGIFGADNPAEDTSAPYQGQYTLDDADTSGSITVTIYDNVGNSDSDTITCTEDAVNPTLSDAMSAYSEDAGDTADVYGDITINTFYFSNSIPSSATVTFTATGSDTGGSGMRGVDFGAFGEDPAEDSSAPYTGQYILDNVDVSGTITVTIYDNVGNSASDTITCTEDGVNPSISITGETESSVYLYAEYGTGTQGAYGSLMSSGQSYVISGTASDAAADLLSVEDDTTTFGGDPSRGGTLTNWQFDYQITSTDNGDVTVTYTATD